MLRSVKAGRPRLTVMHNAGLIPTVNTVGKHNIVEWSFVLAMIGICATLTALQYRWTGELARAETAQLRANSKERAALLCRAFDTELSQSAAQLLPTRAEIDARGREAVQVERLRNWTAAHPRPIFSRIAVARPGNGEIQIFGVDEKAGKLTPMLWPREWAVLQDNLIRKEQGGSPPFVDENGVLLHFPIFSFEGRAGPNAAEWLILELDVAYLRNQWLPDLIRTHLNLGDSLLYDVDVKVASSPATVIFSAHSNQPGNSETPMTVEFNRQGSKADDVRRRPGRDPGGPPSGGGPPPDRGPMDGREFGARPPPPAHGPMDGPPLGSSEGVWVLEVRNRPGALDASVAASRRRNLGVAAALNALIFAATFLLLRYTRRAREFAERQMTFVASVSHELRTPLTVIRGAAHNLRSGVVSDPARVGEYSGIIIRHTEQLTEMVEQVLAFATARKIRSRPTHQPVALGEILRESIAAAEPDTQGARCKVEVEIPPSLPAVEGDAPALRRAFQNLIANAAKHGGAGGWIGISAGIVDGDTPSIEVRVADRGPGIAEDEQGKIFEPFVRGTAAQTAHIRGSGIGLSLVREIIQAHGGGISLHSERGRGTTFTVRLPVTAPAG